MTNGPGHSLSPTALTWGTRVRQGVIHTTRVGRVSAITDVPTHDLGHTYQIRLEHLLRIPKKPSSNIVVKK